MQVQGRSTITGARVRIACLGLLLPALSLVAVGCAGAQAETEAPAISDQAAELATLRRDNAVLRSQVHDLREQLSLLERGTGGQWSDPVAAAGEEYRVDSEGWDEDREGAGPRELPVVKLTPKGSSIGSRPADALPPKPKHRPKTSISLSPLPNSGAPEGYGTEYYGTNYVDTTQYEGDLVSAPEGDGASPASYRLVGSKLVEATRAAPSRPAGARRDRTSQAVRDYDKARAVYEQGKYADAEKAFEAIVQAHPNHDYADNALYWQGEAAYDQAHYADALAAFTSVVERYGGGNKAPDALLKIGLCYGRLGDADNARDVLTQLIAAYPRAQASKIAKRKLADLD